MTTHELPPLRTPLDYVSLCNALLLAWEPEQTGVEPSRAIIELAGAQVGIETGMGSCMNWNLSGIKARANGAYCWQYFATKERVDPATASQQQAANPSTIQIVGMEAGLMKIKVLPKHPWCCFRAYESLKSAVADHLDTMHKHFPRAFEGLLTGNAEQFAHGLKLDRWYTATEQSYEAGLNWRLKQELAVVQNSNIWGDVPERIE
jgi:hypothetical protein